MFMEHLWDEHGSSVAKGRVDPEINSHDECKGNGHGGVRKDSGYESREDEQTDEEVLEPTSNPSSESSDTLQNDPKSEISSDDTLESELPQPPSNESSDRPQPLRKAPGTSGKCPACHCS